MNIEVLKNKITEANYEYRKGTPIITDSQFDNLCDELKNLITDSDWNIFRETLNESVIESGIKVTHRFCLGSQEKIKNSEPKVLDDFIKKYITTRINVSAKVDGISSEIVYKNGKIVSSSSRGNGYVGVSFGDKVKYVSGVPETIPYTDEIHIRGEMVIFEKDMPESDTNRRNICAGYMNKKKVIPSELKKVNFVPYTILSPSLTKKEQFELLEKLGFNTAWYTNLDPNTENLCDVLTELAHKHHDYSCDGLVLIDENAFNDNDNYIPKNSRAFKINELNAVSKIIDVEWSGPSKDGKFVPVAIIEPVELGGATISRASLHNYDIINMLGIEYGSIVEVNKGNDIIPVIIQVVRNSETSPLELPETCPCCGGELKLTDNEEYATELFCNNTECIGRTTTEVETFIKNIGIDFASYATLDKFGIHTIDDLLKFKANPKSKNEVKLENQINEKLMKTSEIDIFCSLNMKDFGEKTLKKIIKHYGWEYIKTYAIDADPFINLPKSIGEITMNKFVVLYKKNLELMNKITSDARYNFDNSTVVIEKESNEDKPSFCVTGSLNNFSRDGLVKEAEDRGFVFKSGVSKGLNYLVNNDKESTSSKNQKAKKLGVQIITEDEFLNIIGYLKNDDL